MEYFQLIENRDLPEIGQFAPFKAILAVEDNVNPDRQAEISSWLVQMGARYVMVCGTNCQRWEESIRQANLEQVNLEEMNPQEFVMITTHQQERLRNVFWHAKKHARHTHVKLQNILALHIGSQNRSVEYLSMFEKA